MDNALVVIILKCARIFLKPWSELPVYKQQHKYTLSFLITLHYTFIVFSDMMYSTFLLLTYCRYLFKVCVYCRYLFKVCVDNFQNLES
jgi:hypothetical protein